LHHGPSTANARRPPARLPLGKVEPYALTFLLAWENLAHLVPLVDRLIFPVSDATVMSFGHRREHDRPGE
jgi:hypothetical protein